MWLPVYSRRRMPLIVFHTRRVREALKRRETAGADLVFLLAVGAVVGGLVMMGREVAAPYRQALEINLSLLALP